MTFQKTSPRKPKPTRRAILAAGLALTLSAGGATAWALDRFVVQHVAIADVSAYEASQGVASETTTVGSSAATVTDTSYTSDGTTIGISKVSTGSGDSTVTYYVADVVLDDARWRRGGPWRPSPARPASWRWTAYGPSPTTPSTSTPRSWTATCWPHAAAVAGTRSAPGPTWTAQLSFLEVKTEGAREATVKERIPYEPADRARMTPEGLDYVNETLAAAIGERSRAERSAP